MHGTGSPTLTTARLSRVERLPIGSLQHLEDIWGPLLCLVGGSFSLSAPSRLDLNTSRPMSGDSLAHTTIRNGTIENNLRVASLSIALYEYVESLSRFCCYIDVHSLN